MLAVGTIIDSSARYKLPTVARNDGKQDSQLKFKNDVSHLFLASGFFTLVLLCFQIENGCQIDCIELVIAAVN